MEVFYKKKLKRRKEQRMTTLKLLRTMSANIHSDACLKQIWRYGPVIEDSTTTFFPYIPRYVNHFLCMFFAFVPALVVLPGTFGTTMNKAVGNRLLEVVGWWFQSRVLTPSKSTWNRGIAPTYGVSFRLGVA
jgi:hypothetical protein